MTMKSASIALLALVPIRVLSAQHDHHGADSAQIVGAADASMNGPMSDAAMKHLEMSPVRNGSARDSARAMAVAQQLRTALAKYADTAAAVADGYRMFAPQVKQQRVYHF